LTVLRAGLKIGLAAGSHWDEQMTITVNNVLVKAYGTGAPPLLDALSAIAAVAWSKTGGRTFVYQATVTFTTPGTNTWLRVWEDDVSMVRVSDVATCDATANSYVPSSDTVSPATLYVHASDGTNPGVNGKLYEFNSRNNGYTSYGVSGCRIIGVNTRRGNDNNGSLVVGRSSTVVNCIAYEGTKHNIFLREGCLFPNVSAYEAYYAGGGSSMFVLADTSPTGLSVCFENCSCENPTYDSSIAGFFWEAITSGSYSSVNFVNCNGNNISTLFSGSGTAHVNISVSIGTGLGVGLRMDAASTYIVDQVDWSGSSDRIIGYNIAGATLILSNSTLTSSHASPLIIYGTNNNSTCTLYNVIFVGNANTVAYYNTGDSQVFTATYCSVPHPANYAWADLGAGDTIVSDYNFYHTGISFKNNGGWVNVANWITNTGQDAHSTVGG
jgi:hypothetical protein